MRANDDAIYNTRKVLLLQPLKSSNSSDTFPKRKLAYVSIGATCVGSVLLAADKGSILQKGQEISWFAFGGSTVVVMFPPNTVKFDPDLLQASAIGSEIWVKMGQQIAHWIN